MFEIYLPRYREFGMTVYRPDGTVLFDKVPEELRDDD